MGKELELWKDRNLEHSMVTGWVQNLEYWLDVLKGVKWVQMKGKLLENSMANQLEPKWETWKENPLVVLLEQMLDPLLVLLLAGTSG